MHIMYWWGPKNFTAPSVEVDFTPGGEFHFCMRSPDNRDYWSKGVYYQIEAPEKIVSTMYFSDEDGDIVSPTKYGMGPDAPSEMLDTITFEEYGGSQTKFTFHRNTPLSISKKYREDEGWNQSLDKFEKEVMDLAGRSIVVSRIFDVPREKVFQAWTNLDSLERWWGPEGFSTSTQKFEFKPGGSWHHILHGPDGRDHENKIVYLEIKDPERIEYKNSGGNAEEQINFHTTVTFREKEGRTKVALHLVFVTEEECASNKEDFGAVEGGRQTLERLNEFLSG